MHSKQILEAGNTAGAAKALILLHGRGGEAGDILSLATHLQVDDFLLLAPQATGNSWYPLSFMAPVTANQPWLDSALDLVDQTVGLTRQRGIPEENLYFLGFSQGACLALEYLARHARRYGGAVAFTGGLIGENLDRKNYRGDFQQTPVLIATSDPDAHVPVTRVYASSNIFRELGAALTEKVYPGMGHTITEEEIRLANQLIFK
ncbi:dienelactone hydrolase family protein [Niabella terrae]